MKGLITYAENTWCPGCGNFGILNAVQKAVKLLEERGVTKDKILITAGIGCHGKIFDYLALSGLYSLHGRSMATAQGMKLGNPELKVIAFAGDGDAFGEGISHVIFSGKRNADYTLVIHDNGVYALTTGQFSPLSPKGFKSPSSPKGTPEPPFNPLKLALISGATFVARGFSARPDHLANLIAEAVMHPGFAIVDVLQPCVTFNNTYQLYNQRVKILEKPAESLEEALKLVEIGERIYIGVIYRRTSQPYHEAIYGNYNPRKDSPSKDERVRRALSLLEENFTPSPLRS